MALPTLAVEPIQKVSAVRCPTSCNTHPSTSFSRRRQKRPRRHPRQNVFRHSELYTELERVTTEHARTKTSLACVVAHVHATCGRRCGYLSQWTDQHTVSSTKTRQCFLTPRSTTMSGPKLLVTVQSPHFPQVHQRLAISTMASTTRADTQLRA